MLQTDHIWQITNEVYKHVPKVVVHNTVCRSIDRGHKWQPSARCQDKIHIASFAIRRASVKHSPTISWCWNNVSSYYNHNKSNGIAKMWSCRLPHAWSVKPLQSWMWKNSLEDSIIAEHMRLLLYWRVPEGENVAGSKPLVSLHTCQPQDIKICECCQVYEEERPDDDFFFSKQKHPLNGCQ